MRRELTVLLEEGQNYIDFKHKIEDEFLHKIISDWTIKKDEDLLEIIGTDIDDCRTEFLEFLKSYIRQA